MHLKVTVTNSRPLLILLLLILLTSRYICNYRQSFRISRFYVITMDTSIMSNTVLEEIDDNICPMILKIRKSKNAPLKIELTNNLPKILLLEIIRKNILISI